MTEMGIRSFILSEQWACACTAMKAVAAALAKASEENKVAIAIRGGMSAREAFETFGVL